MSGCYSFTVAVGSFYVVVRKTALKVYNLLLQCEVQGPKRGPQGRHGTRKNTLKSLKAVEIIDESFHAGLCFSSYPKPSYVCAPDWYRWALCSLSVCVWGSRIVKCHEVTLRFTFTVWFPAAGWC